MSELKDLNDLALRVKENYKNFVDKDIRLSKPFKDDFENYIQTEDTKYKWVKWNNFTVTLTTKKGRKIYCSNQWFFLAAYAEELCNEINKYINYFYEIFNDLYATKSEIKKQAKKIKKENEIRQKEIKEAIEDKFNEKEAKKNFKKFLTNYKWWNGAKLVTRTDYYISPIMRVLNLLQATQSEIAELAYIYTKNNDLSENLNFKKVERGKDSDIPVGKNKILYGAPGTGKSMKLREEYELDNSENVIRVTFHPEYTYHDFVGNYKPVPLYDNNDQKDLITSDGEKIKKGSPVIDYQFTPGPFTKILIRAYNNPEKMFTLIIEELNRANAPSVFGDLFQLLDRNDNGRSIFEVVPDNELLKYINNKTETIRNSIKLPKNLNIVASMNSADEGVFPLDSAFKRRWNFEFLPISFKGVKHAEEKVNYNGFKIRWKDFCIKINKKLGLLGINEDRHIGPYFLKKGEPSDSSIISSKLLTYLWEDVLKHRRGDFFRSDINTFGDLIKEYGKGKSDDSAIFSFKFEKEKISNEKFGEKDEENE